MSESWFVHDISTCVPETALGPAESVALFQQACRDKRTQRLLPRLAKLTGIERRHLAALTPDFAPYTANALYRPIDEQPSGPGMGARMRAFDLAVNPLIDRLVQGLPRERVAEVDLLITASCTHATAPGLEKPLLAHAPIRHSVSRWNLGFMGCSAGLAGLRMLSSMPATGHAALVVACELSSLHFQYTDALDQLTANMLFADGAAGVLLSDRPSRTKLRAAACYGVPSKASQMVWFADDCGLRLELSQELPDSIGAALPALVSEFLGAQGLRTAEVQHWLVHPGGPQILDSVEQALKLPVDTLAISRGVLRNFGNMSSPTIFFILREFLSRKLNGPVMALAFGPGLMIEMVLFEVARDST